MLQRPDSLFRLSTSVPCAGSSSPRGGLAPGLILPAAATTGRRFRSSRHALVAGITRAVIRVSLGLSALGQVCAIQVISNSNKPDLTLLQT
jgi:hypothetical protein